MLAAAAVGVGGSSSSMAVSFGLQILNLRTFDDMGGVSVLVWGLPKALCREYAADTTCLPVIRGSLQVK